MKIQTFKLAAGVLALGFVTGAQAGSIVQGRGYENCLKQIKQELDKKRPKLDSTFYLEKSADHLTFYLNATAWQNGTRKAMRSACQTSTDGNNVLAINTEPGRFVGVPGQEAEVEVASQQ